MAADVRRWGEYCRRTSSSAAPTLGASGATLLCLARPPQVALQGVHPGGQAVLLLGDVRQPRLGGPSVLVGPRQAGLEVAVGGLRADRARLPRPRPLHSPQH